MTQINLLKQTAPTTNLWAIIPKILARFFLVVLIALVAYYAWLIINSKKIAKDIITTQIEINDGKKEGLHMDKREEVLVRQQQLQAVNDTLTKHLYWTQLFSELARVTLKNANYSSIRVGTDGVVTLTGNVPTIADLDKYLQVFDLSAFNKNFSDIRIGGYNKVQNKDSGSKVSFDLMMKFNPAVIQYKPETK